MKLVPRGFPILVLALLSAASARASFLVDPTDGTVLWSDGARYDEAVIRSRPLGFEFSYFEGEPVSTIDVSTNGNLNFSGDSEYANERVGREVMRISPLWDDLEVVAGSGDSVVEKTVAGKLYSVTWRVHEHNAPTIRHGFQAALFGAAMRINGLDFLPGDVVFSYTSIGATFDKDTATVGLDAGDDGATLVPLPGTLAETGVLARSEAGLLPTSAGSFILFRPDEAGSYTASIHLNRTPVATDDTTYSTSRAGFQVEVLANDADPDGDTLTITGVTQGSFGNVSIGANGRLAYTPGPAFAGTDIFTYTVSDPYGLTSTARVTVLPFAAGKGSFDGLLLTTPSEDDPDPVQTNEGAGYFKLALGANGAFSGTLNFGGLLRTLRGKFDAHGDFTTTFSRVADGETQTVTVTLHLDLADENAPLTGMVTDGTFTAQLAAARTRFTAKFPTALAGKYTVLLPPDENGGPLGIGYAQLKITAAGAASLTGKLGDGKTFTFGSFVKPGGTFPLYLALKTTAKARTGSLFGTVKFDSTKVTSDCTAALHWFMPDVGEVSGFEAAPQLVGSRYTAPSKGTRILTLGNGASNAAIDLGAGQFALPVNLDTANKVTVPAAGPEKISVTIQPAAGTFSGSFFEDISDDPPVRKKRTFGGVFLTKPNLGGGLYLDADKAGAAVRITPPPPVIE
jgi:hypothetical protein